MMLQALLNVFRVADLRAKVLFTLAMIAVFRIGHSIPLPGVDQEQLKRLFQDAVDAESAFGRVAQYFAIFSGGTLGQSTIFGLGIMPYISAAIIFQLLQSVSPKLKALREEGPSGFQKIQEWTRLATVGLCIVQAIGWLKFLEQQNLVYSTWIGNPVWWLMAITALTAGTMFLVWLGEQIDKFGIGNGISLIIAAGIISGMPGAVTYVVQNFAPGSDSPSAIGFGGVLALFGGFVLVVSGAVVMTVAQRRIPIQQAKQTRGRMVIGGQRTYLPLRVNHGGVMPVIFASSLMIIPSVLFSAMVQQVGDGPGRRIIDGFAQALQFGEIPYVLCEVVLIYFFSYFWITVQFSPEDMSKQLRDNGSFIPGLRPGPRTEEYLETVMERITFVGAGMLAIIAVLPMVVSRVLGVPMHVSQFLGGTGLLIVVAVFLDLIQRIEANLLMRNYAGFLGGNEDSTGSRLRGPRG